MRWAAERPAEELYDLNADPFETRNLAEDPRHAAVLAGLRRDLDEWMRSQEDQRTLFGVPLRRGEPVTPVVPAAAKKAGR
jgi:arylsulfatase A-like enzyme